MRKGRGLVNIYPKKKRRREIKIHNYTLIEVYHNKSKWGLQIPTLFSIQN